MATGRTVGVGRPVARRRTAGVALATALWLLVAGFAWWWMGRHEDGVLAGVASVLAGVDGHPAAPLVLLLAFVVRPLTLLPVTVLTTFAGFLLGPALGFVVAAVAVVTTSLIPYAFTRMARAGSARPRDPGWGATLATRPFESVLAARLAMVPGDLVNVASGLLRVPVAPFVAATAVGGAPGLLVGVLAGASLQGRFRVDATAVEWQLVGASAVIALVSIAAARFIARRAKPTGAS